MIAEVRLRLDKARNFLRQATGLDPTTRAESIIHLSYYAMYHAAAAALTVKTGSAPAKHAGIIGQFGLLVKDMDDAARGAGRALNNAFDTRLTADYDVGNPELSRDAERIRTDAEAFLRFCETLTAST